MEDNSRFLNLHLTLFNPEPSSLYEANVVQLPLRQLCIMLWVAGSIIYPFDLGSWWISNDDRNYEIMYTHIFFQFIFYEIDIQSTEKKKKNKNWFKKDLNEFSFQRCWWIFICTDTLWFRISGFLSWDKDSCHVDLEKELLALVAQAPEGEEARNGINFQIVSSGYRFISDC